MTEPNLIAQIEKHYRAYVFLGLSVFSGVMLIGRLFRYEQWRQTGISLLLIALMGAIIWGVFGYARIANNRGGGNLYGHQRSLAIVVCAVPAAILLFIAILSFTL